MNDLFGDTKEQKMEGWGMDKGIHKNNGDFDAG